MRSSLSVRPELSAFEPRDTRAPPRRASRTAPRPARLRMPLHADREAPRRILDALDRPVRGPRSLDEPFADAAEALVVVRGDLGARADDRRQPRALLHLDRSARRRSREPACGRRARASRGGAGRGRRRGRRSGAGRRGRPRASACRARAPRRAAPARRRRGAPAARRSPDARRRRTPAGRRPPRRRTRSRRARRASPSTPSSLGGISTRPPARALHCVDVVERDERRRQLPDAPARLLGVGRDPDRPGRCSLMALHATAAHPRSK